jgi:hypothetical protein
MNAPQDAWAGSLAKRLIDRWRSSALSYIKISPGTYNETTGAITLTETPIAAAGAVVKTVQEERDGVMQDHELVAWIDHTTVPWPVSTNDRLGYLGKRWKITEIGPTYGSGGEESTSATYITTLDGKVITTLDGIPLIVQGSGSGSGADTFNMYASKITARAE